MFLVVLPGLDGTAELRVEFIESVKALNIDVLLIAYPNEQHLDYGALESWVRARLPKQETFVLLGESFSGPIAVQIAANPPSNLSALILSTSFLKSPIFWLRPFARLIRLAPLHRSPFVITQWFLLGGFGSKSLAMALKNKLTAIPNSVLSHRASLTMQVDVTKQLRQVDVPVLYLQAAKDRLLDSSVVRSIVNAAPQTHVKVFNAPHLLLQVCPDQVASVISDWLHSNSI